MIMSATAVLAIMLPFALLFFSLSGPSDGRERVGVR
jgi:hypothetical protein